MMNKSKTLHWSFDHNYGAQRDDFAQSMINALDEYQSNLSNLRENTRIRKYEKRVYQILPNLWRGYQANNNKLSIGKVITERKYDENNSIWNYRVHYQNTTSGEDLIFEFCCLDKSYLPLHDKWKVDVKNTSSDVYSKLSLSGHLTSEEGIQLTINNTNINAGTIAGAIPLTCNWALLDVMPIISKSKGSLDNKHTIAILEDLEHLRPNCHLGFLDSINYPMRLDGYYLYGNGLLPSYWWIDANDTTVIVSAVFETLVLQELSGDTQ